MAFVAGHFGEWFQGRMGPDGPLALVTLACPVAGAEVTVHPAETLRIDDPAGVLTEASARQCLAALGKPASGLIRVRLDMPPGGGAGMSTAALVALGRACGAPEAQLAAVALAVEGATDPLMRAAPDQVLWAPREARVISALAPPPRLTVLGGFWGARERTAPEDQNFADISDLLAMWQSLRTPSEAAAIATASARRCTALRGPGGDPSETLLRKLGALGYARAHTGSARAFLFAPGTLPEAGAAELSAAGFTHVTMFETGGRT